MRRFVFMIVILAILVAGGLLTGLISSQGTGIVPGVRVQTSDPAASATYMTAEEGQWFLVWAIFLTLGPLLTLAAVLAYAMWALNRGVVRAKESPRREFDFSLNPTRQNSIGGILARSPSLAIMLAVIVIAGLAVVLAVAFNVFG